ncbi:MAG: FHA domain-containing protein [Planctomycetota bacterium]|jgi:hypothetical protein
MKSVLEYAKKARVFTLEEFSQHVSFAYCLVHCTAPVDEEPGLEPDSPLGKPFYALDVEDTVYPLDLKKGWVWMGRCNPCEVIIDDPNISEVHAQISMQKNDEIFLKDVNSRAGTFLNGEPVTKGLQPLKDRDLVRLGDHPFIFYSLASLYTDLRRNTGKFRRHF